MEWQFFIGLIKSIYAFLKSALGFIKAILQVFYFLRNSLKIRADLDALKARVDKLEKADYKKKNKKTPSDNTSPLPAKRKDLIYHNDLLWQKGGKTPFCPTCYDSDNKLIRMRIIEESIATTSYRPAPSKYFFCPICKAQFPISNPP